MADSEKKSSVLLLSAILSVGLGVVTLWRGYASWYGQGLISGTTAKVYAIVLFAFAAVLFYLHFRKSRK
jgi:hypothetical protein